MFELTPPAFARSPGTLARTASSPSSRGGGRRSRTCRRPTSRLLLVAHAVERPGNLGAVVRTACGAGADALVSCDPCTDLFHADTVHGSVGALFHLPLAEASTDDLLGYLRAREMRIVVATPEAERPYWEGTYLESAAVVVGSERHGVGGRWLAAVDELVAIGMSGAADSLNVPVAAGIVLFEAARQRALEREPAALRRYRSIAVASSCASESRTTSAAASASSSGG